MGKAQLTPRVTAQFDLPQIPPPSHTAPEVHFVVTIGRGAPPRP
jgi:hypothetical protein